MTSRTQTIAKLVLTAVLFFLGATHYLGLLERNSQKIWGDRGDGFFNLWLMDHTYESIRRGDIANIPDGKIFAPNECATFFWSDNLFVPAIPFSMMRAAGFSRFPAFRWTGILLALCFVMALYALFDRIIALARKAGAPPWASWLTGPAACLTFFMPGILDNYFQHFQNLSALWLFVMMAAMLDRLLHPSSRSLIWIGVAQTAMLFSSLYFAVIGAILISLFILFECIRSTPMLWRDGLRALPILAPFILAAIGIAVAYMRVPHMERPQSAIRTFSVGLSDIYTPPSGMLHETLSNAGHTPPYVHHERRAWPGLGIMVGWVLIIPATVIAGIKILRTHAGMQWTLGLFVGAFLLAALLRKIETPAAIIGAMGYAILIIGSLWVCARSKPQQIPQQAIGLLLLFSVVIFALANGPRGRYVEAIINPSVWGIFASIIPGFSRMRAIGRLAIVGNCLLLAAALGGAMLIAARSQRLSRSIAATLIILTTIQLVDILPVRASRSHADASVITPLDDEHAFLADISGTALILPAHPFRRNTFWMLFTARYGNLQIMNGYSSRSTPRWDQIMQYGRSKGEGSPKQITAAREADADWLILFKYGLHPTWRKAYKQDAAQPVFQNERMLVYSLQDQQQIPLINRASAP